MLARKLLGMHPSEKVMGYDVLILKVDGSALDTSSSTAGIIVGSTAVTAKDDGSEVVTITFDEPLRNAPIVIASQCLSADCIIKPDSITATASSLEYSCYKISDASTAVNDADIVLTLVIPHGSDIV